MNFLAHFQMFSPVQFGFLPGRSTIGAIMEVMRAVVDGLDGGEQGMIVLCDLAKAFDCVSHDVLCTKLQHYGIRGVPFQLVISPLSARLQCVKLRDRVSKLTPVPHGIRDLSLDLSCLSFI